MDTTASPGYRRDIAHLGHAQLLTPDLEGSTWFFSEILGLTPTWAGDGSVHLRTWDNYEQTSLVLTQADRAGIGRITLRAASPEALDRLVAESQAAGQDGEWVDGEAGTGRTWLTQDPDGHPIGLYWESRRYEAPVELAPALKNQPQAKPTRGVAARRLDHINFLARDVDANVDWVARGLGGRISEQIQLDDGSFGARWFTFTQKTYDLVYTADWTGSTGRLHHLAFCTDTREEILRAADIAIDRGVPIETGPHKHTINQTFFLYLFEPGGNRIELCNPLTRLLMDPEGGPVTWTQAERARGQAWGLRTIDSFHTHGTPAMEGAADFRYSPPEHERALVRPALSGEGVGALR